MLDEIDKSAENAKKLSSFEILKHFQDESVHVIVYETIDSTNSQARRFLKEGKEPPFLLLSEEQTSGRGRHGNSFFSPESGFYYTLTCTLTKEAAAKATIAAAVSLREAIEEVSGISCSIKWVNDLYYRKKKVAGILCEAPHVPDENQMVVIIGIGVNIAQRQFPEELKEKAGSLGCKNLDRNLLAAVLTQHLTAWLKRAEDPRLMEEYRNHSFLLGKQVSFVRNGILYTGIAKDISDEGNLIVSGEESWVLSSGEVSLSSWESSEED